MISTREQTPDRAVEAHVPHQLLVARVLVAHEAVAMTPGLRGQATSHLALVVRYAIQDDFVPLVEVVPALLVGTTTKFVERLGVLATLEGCGTVRIALLRIPDGPVGLKHRIRGLQVDLAVRHVSL